MKKSWKYLIPLSLLAYFGLLGLMTRFESASPDSNIQNYTDAVWYSIVTMTTVGYRDYYPVTLGGRLIGFVFLLLSIGFLAFLVGAAISLLIGKLFPVMILKRNRGRSWYIFSEDNADGRILGANLLAEDPECLVIFAGSSQPRCEDRTFQLNLSMDEILTLHGKDADNTAIFLCQSEIDNYEAACRMPSHVRSAASTDRHPETLPLHVTLFDPYESIARHYWSTHPLKATDGDILIVGNGEYAALLFEHALLSNVVSTSQHFTYHLFGDWSGFRRNFYHLDDAVNCGNDLVVYHTDHWNSAPALIENAKRIILCQDNDSVNLQIQGDLNRFFTTDADVHVLSNHLLIGPDCFGAKETITTPEYILREKLTQSAKMVHQLYSDAYGGTAAWEELSEFHRQSNIAAADHLLTKVNVLLPDETITDLSEEVCRRAYKIFRATFDEKKDEYREIEHIRWCRFHFLHNWSYAPVRDNAKRKHPLLVPYADLVEADRVKDDFAWELLEKWR